MTPGRIRVRAARHDDRAFVVDAAGRLEEFGAPPFLQAATDYFNGRLD